MLTGGGMEKRPRKRRRSIRPTPEAAFLIKQSHMYVRLRPTLHHLAKLSESCELLVGDLLLLLKARDANNHAGHNAQVWSALGNCHDAWRLIDNALRGLPIPHRERMSALDKAQLIEAIGFSRYLEFPV